MPGLSAVPRPPFPPDNHAEGRVPPQRPAIDPTARYPGCPLADYQRWRILPRLVDTRDLDMREPVFTLVEPADLAATLAVVERLRLALERAERRRLARHWSYAGTPHEALRQAHTAERWIESEQEQALAGRREAGS